MLTEGRKESMLCDTLNTARYGRSRSGKALKDVFETLKFCSDSCKPSKVAPVMSC